MPSFLLDPIGFRLDGRPFYGFSGAEGDEDTGKEDTDPDEDEDDKPEEKDPVKRLESTLAKVRQERREVQDELRSYRAAARAAGINTPDALKEALTKPGKQDAPVDAEKIREEARREARQEANRDVALAKLEAKAKGMFEDPQDAVDYARKNVDDLLDSDGKPSQRAIERELADLLAAKPHWGVKKTGDLPFEGGARQPSGNPQGMDGFIRNASRAKRGQ